MCFFVTLIHGKEKVPFEAGISRSYVSHDGTLCPRLVTLISSVEAEGFPSASERLHSASDFLGLEMMV